MTAHEDLDRTALRSYTNARVGLRSAGTSLATAELLDMAQSLAEARDAVHAEFSTASLLPQIAAIGLESVVLKSAARNRAEYLRRPDLGRKLTHASRELLESSGPRPGESRIAIVIADGLSAIAAERHAQPLLTALLPLLADRKWQLFPIVLVEQARVGLGDEIGERLKADALLMLIGERPGLSSPDSLGAYITWAPRHDRTDAERNCISNIRPEGLSYPLAARKIAGYLNEARRLQLTGVALKEDSPLLEE
jgi:ethanolamine ammonia-lyase small subunit